MATSVSPNAPPSHYFSLDCIRGIAIILVLLCHVPLSEGRLVESNSIRDVLLAVKRGGWVGVDLFFVISGLLVSGILFREHQRKAAISARRFLVRRAWKIYPSFWLLLLVTSAFTWCASKPIATHALWAEILFVQNYYEGIYPHTWSLALEEHCYLGLCVLITLMAYYGRGSPDPFRLLLFILPTCLVLAVLTRIYALPEMLASRRVLILGATHLRCDAFLAGTVVSYLAHFRHAETAAVRRAFRRTFLVIGMAMYVPAFFPEALNTRVMWIILPTMNAIGGSLVILWALEEDAPRSYGFGLLAFIGRCSYSTYLWHVLVCDIWLAPVASAYGLFDDEVAWICVYMQTALLSGAAASFVVEKPMLRLRDRWFPGW